MSTATRYSPHNYPALTLAQQDEAKRYAAGYAAYVSGRGITEMVDEHMRRGWLAANEAEVEAVLPGYAERNAR